MIFSFIQYVDHFKTKVTSSGYLNLSVAFDVGANAVTTTSLESEYFFYFYNLLMACHPGLHVTPQVFITTSYTPGVIKCTFIMNSQ